MEFKTNFQKLYEDGDLGYYDSTQDSYNKMSLSKPRQQKLTLKMLIRLKKIRRTKRLENSLKNELLGAMYGVSTDNDE